MSTNRARVIEWIRAFPEVKLNLFADTDGDWLCWAILRGYGAVLWRQDTHPGQRAGIVAWTLAGLPMRGGKLPEKAVMLSACVNLTDLEKTLAKRAEEAAEDAEKAEVKQKHSRRAQHTPKHTAQHTIDFASAANSVQQ